MPFWGVGDRRKRNVAVGGAGRRRAETLHFQKTLHFPRALDEAHFCRVLRFCWSARYKKGGGGGREEADIVETQCKSDFMG